MSRNSLVLFLAFAVLYLAIVGHSIALPRAKVQSNNVNRPPPPANPTDEFCMNFIRECYHVALDGKEGHVKVVHACQRNGNKFSKSYSFGCKADGVDETQTVLNKIGGGYTVTETVSGSTVVITGTVTDVVTSTSATTSVVDVTVTDHASSTSTQTSVVTGTVSTVLTTTVTSTIPVTKTSTSTSTITTTTPVTTTVATSTITSVSLGVLPIPIMQVVLSPPVLSKRAIDNSTFCSAFSAGCVSQCARVHSHPKHTVCHATSLHHYNLACKCNNGKMETQHALAAAVDQEHIATVSTVTTSTSYTTATSTSIIPTTVLSTSYITITNTVPVTNTYTTSSTVTKTSTTTSYSSVTSTVATSVPTTSTTTTATSTSSVTATSTTNIVVAPTGAIKAFSTIDDSDQGYLYYNTVSDLNYVTTDSTQAQSYMAVLDLTTGLFQLQSTDGSGNVFIAEGGYQGEDFTQPSAYAWTYPGPPSSCATSGTAPGPPAGSGPHGEDACETYVFGVEADSQTLSDGKTLNLTMEWYNPGATSAIQYGWILDYTVEGVYAAATPDGINEAYGEQTIPISLRFPE